ncbi:hypothetical protein [Streptomyces sp. NPDC096311]|uniref:rhamnogalacturonan lyase family protein n=1 Tax=Streptomyces sp. NPDC096311 TaxID=3366083 RepID=UPI003826C32E
MRPRRLGVGTAAALPAGLVAASSHATEQHPPPRRIVENLDRGPVAVPSGKGTFLSRRLPGTECALPQVLGSARTGGTPTGDAIAFNVHKGGRRLNQAPVARSTTYQDDSRGTGTYTVRAVVNGHERKPSSAALDLARGYAEIPPAAADGYTVQHAWPGDLDGDGRYELVVSRLAQTRDKPDLLEAYTLTGARLWRVDLGPGSYTQVGGNGANDPAPATISGSTPIGGYRNDDNVTVYDLDGDGKAEVLVHTADGTTFADGAKVTANSPAHQFISVIDGETGTERTRQPVPDDLVADGPSGGHFGIADLDGVHPSLVTKLVTRGSAADIDPGRPGYGYWTSTADVTRPGAGVFNAQDGKVSTTTPSVNFRSWWDGDKGAELLDCTHVDKWDPKAETSTRLFDPAGVVPGARNATPFYGDLLGDGREEILAETGDHTALRLCTTTEPTKTRIHTLAQNPGHRLGWTVRGHLQSTYTDYCLGTETRRVPKPAVTTAARTEGTS